MKYKQLFPYAIFMLLLLGLLVCILFFFRAILLDHGQIIFEDMTFMIYSGSIMLLSFTFGSVWMSSQKSWDIESFAQRLENVDSCGHVIFRTETQKKFLEKQEKMKGETK